MLAPIPAVPGLAGVLAHQGGWDEALMVLVPVGLFGVLLRMAIVRADRSTPADRAPGQEADDG